MYRHDPILVPVKVSDLRPTQMTVGYREVAEKRKRWKERADADGPEFLGSHTIPVVKGPKGALYVVDHHHLARALHEEGVEKIAVNVIADLAKLKRDEFWAHCDNRGWCHPYDEDGERRGFDKIPRSIDDLKDDPFRSLAGQLRRAGGCAKEDTPFTEFMWADFLRRRIKRKLVEDDFSAAMVKALSLARSPAAEHLPGWCGPAS
jgi:hypothetical protein